MESHDRSDDLGGSLSEIRAVPDIASSELWNCPGLLSFRCPQEWDRLTPTEQPGVRFCYSCQREVHRCPTPAEFIRHGRLGHCVAIPPDVAPGALTAGWLGEPSPEVVQESELQNRRILDWWSQVSTARGAMDPEQVRKLRELL